MRRPLVVVALLVGCQSGSIQGGDGGGVVDAPIGSSVDAPRGSGDAPRAADAPRSADAPRADAPRADAPSGGSPDAPIGGSPDAPSGGNADAPTSPTGDPATGPGGGSNLNCGGASFPPNATFYQDISNATLDPLSAPIIDELQTRGWGTDPDRTTLGIDFSFNLNCADDGVARRAYDQNGDNQPDCDLAPVPLPTGGKVEGVDDYSCDDGDCHLLVYQGTRLYELYQANITGGQATGGTFTGSCLAIWDLTHDYWDPATNQSPDYSRGDHCDGGNAADVPIAPMLLTKQEVEAALAGDGIIHHALRFTMKNNRIRAGHYVHPATHLGNGATTGDENTLATGARIRLRGDYPLASLPSDAARVVARTLQRYGMYLSDGGNIFISATGDAAAPLGGNSIVTALQPSDFEVVNGGRRIAWDDYDCNRTVITN